jgi:hypothetical protein
MILALAVYLAIGFLVVAVLAWPLDREDWDMLFLVPFWPLPLTGWILARLSEKS